MATLITVKTYANYKLVHNSNINPTTSWFLTHRLNSTSEEPLTGILEIATSLYQKLHDIGDISSGGRCSRD